MERKRKACFTTDHTRQVYNCKGTDFQSDLQGYGAKCMNVVLSEASKQAVCPRTGEASLLFIINKRKGDFYGA